MRHNHSRIGSDAQITLSRIEELSKASRMYVLVCLLESELFPAWHKHDGEQARKVFKVWNAHCHPRQPGMEVEYTSRAEGKTYDLCDDWLQGLALNAKIEGGGL